jgi:ABC-type sugar transport system permease subunit
VAIGGWAGEADDHLPGDQPHVVRRWQTLRGRETVWGLLFAAPTVVFLAVFSLAPMAYALAISFTRFDLTSPPEFIGFGNYRSLLTDSLFHNSLRVTAFYVLGTVIPVWAISLGLALLLVRARVFSSVWRTLLFLPSVLPLVSVALVWKLFFHLSGPMNDLLGIVGVAPVQWLTSTRLAPLALIVMSWWHAASYYMVIFLAGLLAIPRTLYEAAELDGAGGWQRFRDITIPLLRTTLFLVIVISIINGLRTFVFQQVLTTGGPGTSTQVITLLIYQTAFSFTQMGRASAMSIVLFVLVLCFSIIQYRLFRERE